MMTETKHTKPFYNTEIPGDWEVMEFGQFVEVSKNKYNPAGNGNQKCLELEHIEQGTGAINGWTNSVEQKSIKNRFKKGQVLFGKLRPYLQKYWLAEFDGVCSSEIWVLKSVSEKCTNNYLSRLVQTNRFIQAANVSSGSKMPRADWNYVSSIPFPLPPPEEQKAIADLLHLMDTAINKNNELIAKKKLQKKGLMQRFFSDKMGDKRYEMRKVKLGDLIKLASGDAKPSLVYNESSVENAYPVYGGNGIMGYSSKHNSDGEKIIIGRVGEYCGVTRFVSGKCWITDNALFTTNIDNGVTIDFLTYKLQYENLSKLKNRGGQPLVSQKPIYSLSLIVHSSLKTQRKIVQVLQAADKEISLLQTKTDKLREQKKGLMQQLLTGKKRLKIDNNNTKKI